MLCHRINTTLNSSVGTDFFGFYTILKIVIMHRSLTYLILIIRLVVKSAVNSIKDQIRNTVDSRYLEVIGTIQKYRDNEMSR
jgi:hypothetical protein